MVSSLKIRVLVLLLRGAYSLRKFEPNINIP